jgi:hypothetical protein
LLLLIFFHVQVPILAPVRQIDATPNGRNEYEDEFEYEYDRRTKTILEVRGRENLVLIGGEP